MQWFFFLGKRFRNQVKRHGYLFLAIAIVSEVIGTTALKASDGYSHGASSPHPRRRVDACHC
jgi:hypothetical protein